MRHEQASCDGTCIISSECRQGLCLLCSHAESELTCPHMQVDKEKEKLEDEIAEYSPSHLHDKVSQVWNTRAASSLMCVSWCCRSTDGTIVRGIPSTDGDGIT